MTFRSAIACFEPPLWWRVMIIAISTLVLCACRAPMGSYHGLPAPSTPEPAAASGNLGRPSYQQVQQASHVEQVYPTHVHGGQHFAPSPALPHPAAYPHAGVPTCEACGPGTGNGHGIGYGGPYSSLPYQQPRIPTHRPDDEYICDGGDKRLDTRVGRDFMVYGLDLEDTVAHYDTLDGRREVEPSNRVCVYAPRFAAVRQVRGISQHEQHDFIGRVHQPLGPMLSAESQLASQLNQPLQPVGQIGTRQTSTFRERNAGVPIDAAQGIIGLDGTQRLVVPFRVLATGVYEQSEEARLANAIEAAFFWSHDLAVEVLINEKRLAIDTHDTKLGQTYAVEGDKSAAIRVIKVASKKEAQPGDIIEFTIRFDNVGEEAIGNVTILDNLTTRLEYVEDSQSCTLESGFFVENNEGESLALRWEVIEPMEPGDGGVVTFKCRVR